MRFRSLLVALFALAAAPALAQRPGVVLISLDTFRADRLEAYGGPGSLTPRLNALGKRGAVFGTCNTPVPITLPAHATLLTGCDPRRTGIRDNGEGSLAQGLPSLAGAFRAAGYETRAILASVVLEGRYGLERDFSAYDDDVGPSLRRTAAEVTDRAIGAVRGAAKPLFLWVHYFDTHEIYESPEPYASRHAKHPYDGSAAFVDAEVGRLLEALPRNTLVAVVADHGESLGEHGEQTHGILLFQATVKVPFLLAGPGVPAGKSISTPCSLADVAPTLCSLAGLRLSGRADGRDLTAALAGRGVAPRAFPLETWLPYDQFRWLPLVGVTDGRWKWIRGKSIRLFDGSTDPREEKDLAAKAPREALLLRASLPSLPGKAPATSSFDPSIVGLGYSPVPTGGGALKGLPDPHDRVAVLKDLDSARFMRLRGDEARALSLFQQACASDPKNPTAWFEAGETCRRMGRQDEAAKALDKCLAIAPTMAVAWTSRGHVWVAQSKNEAAVACYQKALNLNPNMIEASNPLAAHYLDLNQPDKAFPLLNRAVAEGFANSDTYLMQGRIHLIQNKPEEARKDFIEALHLSENPAITLKAEADILLLRDFYREAVGFYEEGIRLYPAFAPNYLTLGGCYLQAGKPDKALPLYKKALGLDLSEEDLATVQEIVDDLERLLASEPGE